jgi:hypothetical protein
MDFNSTVDLIIKDLDEARKIIDDLKNYPGVPILQIELAKSKCRSAGEVISLLKYLREEPQSETRRSSPSTKKEKTAVPVGKVPESTIIADTFSHLPGTMNEQLGSLRNDDDVSEILKAKPLTNLSDAIGVNDKFLFIRELFNGSPEAYDQAISKINSSGNFTDARALVLSYTTDNKETEAVRQLLELVKRKFPADE